MAVIEVNAAEFEAKVLKADKPVIVDFWAVWCGPCAMMGPVLEEIAAEQEEVIVAKVNCDENMDLAQGYGVTGIPCFMVFKNGEVAGKAVGAMSKEELWNELKQYV